MKNLLIAILAFSSFVTFAEETKVDLKKDQNTETEHRESFKEKIARYTGGMLVRPGTRLGEIVYVNCQTRAKKELLEESATYFADETKLNVTVKEGKFSFPSPEIIGNLSLFVVDDPSLPPILAAPQSRWALVNIAQLTEGAGEKEAFFDARVRKQLTRGFSILCGATNSGYPDALTGGIFETKKLDKYVDHILPVDVISRFVPYLAPLGVTPAVSVTYRKACKEGWAPAPTNDIQKAIVEEIANEKKEVEKGPKTPRKIRYNKKRGE